MRSGRLKAALQCSLGSNGNIFASITINYAVSGTRPIYLNSKRIHCKMGAKFVNLKKSYWVMVAEIYFVLLGFMISPSRQVTFLQSLIGNGGMYGDDTSKFRD